MLSHLPCATFSRKLCKVENKTGTNKMTDPRDALDTSRDVSESVASTMYALGYCYEANVVAGLSARIDELEGAIDDWNIARLASTPYIRGTENALYDAGMKLIATLEKRT